MNGFAIVYALAGGLLAYSGIKGATIADTVKAVFSGNLSGLSDTETIGSPTVNVSNPSSSDSGSTSGTTGGSGSLPAGDEPKANTPEDNQAAAKAIATSMGLSSWTTGTQWSDWVNLWNQESGWSTTAQNPSSTAYGIAQFLDTTWAAYGPKTTDPGLQIKYGIEYIQQRYGSPSMAWAHEQANNWY